MKALIGVIVIAAVAAIFALGGCGGHDHGSHDHGNHGHTGKSHAMDDGYPVDYCVVSGDMLIDDEIIEHEYKGQKLKFCCKMCIKDFNKDPEKYLKILQDAKK